MKKNKVTAIILVIVLSILGICAGVNVNIQKEGDKINATIEYSEEQIPASIEDMGEVKEIDGEEIPTVEEVDGGLFEDETTGLSMSDGEYEDLGAVVETFPTNTPEAFRNATLGKCVRAGNRYGSQCVSLARSYWFSYAGRDVSTCGTGMAKGMMNCAAQNAGNDFVVYWKESAHQIQSGDWLVFDGGQYGHIGMALGSVTNGYVALLGENQGGRACEGGGAATNIINISIRNLIGFYRPKAYIKPAPKPTPTPTPAPTPSVDKCKTREVVKGDTLGKIMKECKGETKWGSAMNEYASHWYSLKFKKYLTVYDGWASANGVGLFAGDTIEYRAN